MRGTLRDGPPTLLPMHGDPSFLAQLLLVIAIAAAGVAAFERVGLPAIAGFLVVGALVGPGALGLAPSSDAVRSIAEFGVVFLLFEIGLELPLASLRRAWRTALAAGGLQVSSTICLVAVLARLLGVPWPNALVLGGLAAMSSTALVMRMLQDRGELDAPHGRLSVFVLLLQDLCVVPMLLGLPILAGTAPAAAGSLALAVGKSVGALGLLFAIAYFALPRALDRVARLGSRDLFSLVAFLLVIGGAVAAERLGLTLAVGAFAAGLVLGSSPYAHQLVAEIGPLRGVLLGIFFTAVGMLFDPREAVRLWPQVLLFVVAVLPLKAAVLYGVAVLVLRNPPRVGVMTAAALSQTGEFSFVLAAAAASQGLLTGDLQHVFVAGSLLSLLATPLALGVAPAVAAWLVGGRAPALGARDEGPAKAHVVIVGFGNTGRTLARVLRILEIPYRVLEGNANTVAEARRVGEPITFGDATRLAILSHLAVAEARLVAIAISDPLATRAAVSLARGLAPRVPIVVRTRYVSEVDELVEAGATLVIAEEFEATLDLLSSSLRALGLPGEAIERLADQMRSEGYELLRAPPALLLDPWLGELLREGAPEWIVVPEGPADGRSIAELAIRTRSGASVLAIERGDEIRANPSPDERLAAGDRLLVLAGPDSTVRLRALLAGDA